MDSIVNNAQTIKLGLHIAQAVFIFVAWCIEIAYFRTAVFTGANPGWFFGLCFLSIPAILYQTMTARFPRSRRFSNPYAHAIIDLVYTILWLSAWAAMASWNAGAWCIGACQLSAAMLGLGVMVFLFFALTSALSVYGVIYFKNHGSLPGSRIPTNAAMIDPDHEAFSTLPHDEYAPVGMQDHDDHHAGVGGVAPSGQPYDADSYAGGYAGSHVGANTSTSYGGAYVSPSVGDEMAYSGGYNASEVSSAPSYSTAPAQSGPDRVQFPAANYTK